ncbi:MAG: 5'-nucleotidase C-terminal domain-containing protein [Bacteroidia bacterium]|jgi:2',3'-cyclic-nucleotide 2'-phosphodiesterase (5'-nucleotidase family)
MNKTLSLQIHPVFIHLLVWMAFISCQSRQLTTLEPSKPREISGKELTDDSDAEALIVPYRKPLQEIMQQVLCYSGAPATKELPESSLGNLICDLLRIEGSKMSSLQVDVAFMNQGGLRIEWPKGAITRSMVLEIMPFENRLQLIAMDSSQFKGLLEQIAKRGGAPISGLRMEINQNNQLQSWSGTSITPKSDGLIYLLTSDYLVNGGDSYTIGYQKLLWTGPKVRDGIEQAIVAVNAIGDTLKPAKDGRITKLQSP